MDHNKEGIIIANGDFRFQSTQLTDRLDIFALLDLQATSPRFLGPPLAPTFKTININCLYSLKAQTGTIGGKVKIYHGF